MSMALETDTSFSDLGLSLPALARLRLHQTWTAPLPVSSTQAAELWLADLDLPVRLSRWAHGFRSYDLGAFTADEFAARKRDVLTACGRTDGRVLMLAQPARDAVAPRIYWVLEEDDTPVAHIAEIVHDGERLGLFVTGAEGRHVQGRLVIDGTPTETVGQLRAHLDADGVRVGLQLTSVDGSPVLTMSLTGTLASGSSRALIQSAQRAAASQRVLAA